MQAKGFFSSLFDYSFTSFVTPRIIKVLYVLATIVISLSTLALILAAFKGSSGFGVVMLVVGPLFFLLSMIYARVFLELVIVFFRINGNVQEIRDGRSGGAVARDKDDVHSSAAAAVAPAVPAASTQPEGWYDDSARAGHTRWWDGTAWGIRDDEHPSTASGSPLMDAEIAAPSTASPPKTGQEPVEPATAIGPTSEAAPAAASPSASEPASAPPPTRFCENCGAERSPGGSFCTSCGHA